MLLTYLEGEDLSDVLPALSPKRQLNLGVEAGRYLNKIHKLCCLKGLVKERLRKIYKKSRAN